MQSRGHARRARPGRAGTSRGFGCPPAPRAGLEQRGGGAPQEEPFIPPRSAGILPEEAAPSWTRTAAPEMPGLLSFPWGEGPPPCPKAAAASNGRARPAGRAPRGPPRRRGRSGGCCGAGWGALGEPGGVSLCAPASLPKCQQGFARPGMMGPGVLLQARPSAPSAQPRFGPPPAGASLLCSPAPPPLPSPLRPGPPGDPRPPPRARLALPASGAFSAWTDAPLSEAREPPPPRQPQQQQPTSVAGASRPPGRRAHPAGAGWGRAGGAGGRRGRRAAGGGGGGSGRRARRRRRRLSEA